MPNVCGYYVYRDDSLVPLNQEPITVATYQDIGLTNGRTYRYTVAAVDSTGEIGLHSTEIAATPNSK